MHGFAQVSARLRLVERGAARTGAKSGVAERNSGTWRRRWDWLRTVSASPERVPRIFLQLVTEGLHAKRTMS